MAMKLHPYLPTIIPMDSCPRGKVFLVPPIEMVRIVAPDGTVLAENIEYHRRQVVMIENLPLPAGTESCE
jgi:hypothetical protein